MDDEDEDTFVCDPEHWLLIDEERKEVLMTFEETPYVFETEKNANIYKSQFADLSRFTPRQAKTMITQ